MSQQTTVALHELSIGYRQSRQARTVAAGISAVLRQGELTCLLGSNGVGKSTLLRTLSAFQPKLSGTITMPGGRDIDSYSAQELSMIVSVVLTEKPNVRNLSVAELVGLGRSPYTGFWGTLGERDRQIVRESLDLVGIGHLHSRMVHTLSDGERQKVMIAKALAQQTPVVYLDEPTAFLDYPSKVEVMLLLRHICRQQEKTVFLSTHDVELALQTADTLWLMDRERGIITGTPRQLADHGDLQRFIQRPGIAFDEQELTIRVEAERGN